MWNGGPAPLHHLDGTTLFIDLSRDAVQEWRGGHGAEDAYLRSLMFTGFLISRANRVVVTMGGSASALEQRFEGAVGSTSMTRKSFEQFIDTVK